MNSSLYVAAGPRACVYVCWGVLSGVGLPRHSGAERTRSVEARGRGWRVEAGTKRGAPAPAVGGCLC